ncbi:MAG TPA: CusA/CzcA family heavy metal efflux RND transporter [Candidatus Binataceae bacterium]|nr:CusA/CzcA family heavy metal efflux RND transporter [Candidatus Binataceae bacterium]
MIKVLMDLALRQRAMIVVIPIVLAIAGLYSFREMDIEAYPDPVQPRVEIITQPLGLSAEEVEKIATIPLEVGLAGLRNLEAIRTISLFGLSDIKLYFGWDSDYYWDRTETINRLGLVSLPQNLTPSISPDNPIGEIYRYIVQSPDHNLLEEKTVEDWVLEKQLKTVSGIEDVSGFGGLTKQYHVDVDAAKLNHYQLSLATLTGAIANANISVGGNYVDAGQQSFDVRGLGLIGSLDDIRNIVLTSGNATLNHSIAIPARVRDVADVSVGYAPRLGIVGRNDRDEVVEGIVLMRKYGDTLKTLKGVEAKVAELNTSGMMPSGYRLVPYYDRTKLVRLTLETVFENLGLGMLLVFLVLIFFLGNLRTAVIAALNIPLAMCGAFVLLYLTGVPANLLSLGALDFGIIIDSTVIVVENIYRHLTTDSRSGENDLECIRRASLEVGGPMFYSTLIFVIAFLPLFTMRGVEGVIFSPMSHTYAFALTTAILLAVTLTPVLSSYLLRKGMKETHNVVWEGFHRFYHNLFVRILRWPYLTLAIIILIMAGGLAQFPRLGGEFLPKLEEGNIWARATLPLSISLSHANEVARRVREIFRSFPEVTDVISQTGRPDDGTDATGFFNVEFNVDLKPASQWRPGLTKDKLTEQIDDRLTREFPEASFGYSQYIEDNIEEALSGVKGVNAIKVYGPDLVVDERVANEVREVIGGVAGIADVAVYRAMGQPNLLIKPDRQTCSRYGLNVGDVGAAVQAAIGGQAVTQVLEGDRRFDLVVRWQPRYRQSFNAIRQIQISLPGGGYVPLGQVADITTAEGASFIYREGLRRYVPVRFSVRGRDMQTAVDEAKGAVATQVKLPEGVSLNWAGEYSELQEANRRFAIVIPLALLLITAVLYAATRSMVNTLILMAQVPLACFGGVLALVVTGTPFSVSAAVGFISIFAIAIMDGILLNFYIHQLWNAGHSVVESIVMGADRRFRALMMTALVDGLGLLPAALSTRIGAQTQRPLAIVVIGGSISIALLTRVFQPTLVYLLHNYIGLTDVRGNRAAGVPQP